MQVFCILSTAVTCKCPLRSTLCDLLVRLPSFLFSSFHGNVHSYLSVKQFSLSTASSSVHIHIIWNSCGGREEESTTGKCPTKKQSTEKLSWRKRSLWDSLRLFSLSLQGQVASFKSFLSNVSTSFWPQDGALQFVTISLSKSILSLPGRRLLASSGVVWKFDMLNRPYYLTCRKLNLFLQRKPKIGQNLFGLFITISGTIGTFASTLTCDQKNQNRKNEPS